MYRVLSIIMIVIIFFNIDLLGCTSGIISGKFTNDGRPLMFKHRDTGQLQNKLMFFEDGDYDYIAVVNTNDTQGKAVWMGTNASGFSIMNTASYNLIPDNDTTKIKDLEGELMKIALQKCASVDEFENLLNELPKPLGVSANFGVIDAEGGAAYFETDNFNYTKIDVNDSKNAPFGYVIRTNYSFTGTRDDGYGYIRYLTTEELLYNAEATKEISYKFILTQISRSLKHSLLKVDWMKEYPKTKNQPFYLITMDYIPRYSSASSYVVKGVKEGENPDLTTMWTILGYPLTAVAVPTWVAAGNSLPTVTIPSENGKAPLCNMALKLKEKVYPIKRGHGNSYLNLNALLNGEGTGIYQRLRPIEDKIFVITEDRLNNWYKNGFSKEDALIHYKEVDEIILETYKVNFGL